LLESVAALLRDYHDAIDGWRPATSTWQISPVAAGRKSCVTTTSLRRARSAEDRPGWQAQWEQAEPWRHGSGFLRDLEFVRELPELI
jgi:hypothetical protein